MNASTIVPNESCQVGIDPSLSGQAWCDELDRQGKREIERISHIRYAVMRVPFSPYHEPSLEHCLGVPNGVCIGDVSRIYGGRFCPEILVMIGNDHFPRTPDGGIMPEVVPIFEEGTSGKIRAFQVVDEAEGVLRRLIGLGWKPGFMNGATRHSKG